MYEPFVYPYNTQNMPKFNAQGNFMQRQEVVRVNGENGARAYNLAPNSSILMLDETAPIVWLKTTDGAGYPTLVGYDIFLHKSTEEKAMSKMEEIEKRLTKIEEAVINDKSDVKSTEQQQVIGVSEQNTTVQKYDECYKRCE